jgi:hypothetical protein
MRGLAGVIYFMVCGYLFAKYEGDRLLIEAGRKVLRAIVTEAAAVSREIAPPPPHGGQGDHDHSECFTYADAEDCPVAVMAGMVACPVCGDTYANLPEHLASGRKGCGPVWAAQWREAPQHG